MHPEQFVDVIKKAVSESAVEGVISALHSPPGRRPQADLMAMSAFWHTASGEQKEMITRIVRLAVDDAALVFYACWMASDPLKMASIKASFL